VRDALTAAPIAWSEQWTAPSENAPFRYGGAAGPIKDGSPMELFEQLAALTLRLGVRGLASADFIDDGERLWLLEIQPAARRPPSVFFDTDDDPLLTVTSTLSPMASPRPRSHANPKASAIVYAEFDTERPVAIGPTGVRSPIAGIPHSRSAPICTVSASGATAADARAETAVRSRRIQTWLREAAL